jgi:hypothetical protein
MLSPGTQEPEQMQGGSVNRTETHTLPLPVLHGCHLLLFKTVASEHGWPSLHAAEAQRPLWTQVSPKEGWPHPSVERKFLHLTSWKLKLHRRASICSPVWPWTWDSPASDSSVLGLHRCNTTLDVLPKYNSGSRRHCPRHNCFKTAGVRLFAITTLDEL